MRLTKHWGTTHIVRYPIITHGIHFNMFAVHSKLSIKFEEKKGSFELSLPPITFDHPELVNARFVCNN